MRRLSAVLRTRKWIFLFSLTVLLPSLFLGLLAIRAFQGEEIRQRYQSKERQQQIVRLLETDLNSWLVSLQTDFKASEPLFKLQIGDDRIVLPSLNVVILSHRSRDAFLGLSGAESRLWREAEVAEEKGHNRPSARSKYSDLVKTQPRLAPLARLSLLRLSLQDKQFQAAEDWLNSIRKYDREAITESGIPIWVASSLLLVSHGRACQPGEAAASPFAGEVLTDLLEGHWRLAGAQWVLYTKTIGEALQACDPQSQAQFFSISEESLAQPHQLVELVHSFIEAYPQILSLKQPRQAGSPIPIQKKYFPQLEAFIAAFPGEDGHLGILVDRRVLEEFAEERLQNLTVAEDFHGSLIRLEDQDRKTVAQEELFELASFPSFAVTFLDKENSGGLFDFRRHFFFYSMGFLLLVAVSGLIFTYRAVSHEMEVARLKADFVSAVSHEFRSPLTAIQALLERLELERVSDKPMLKRYHQVIRQEVHRLATLVNGLLDFARLEKGRKEFHLEPSDLVQLLREAVKSFHNLGHGERVHLIETDTNSIVVPVDRTAVAQCIQNLIDNAIKYSPKDSPVTVCAGRENGEIFLEVNDQGPGIPESDREKIFEQFYRTKNSDIYNVKGVGIGLALVKQIMEKHGGRIAVKSQLGEGSTFRLVFPEAHGS